MSEPRLPLFVPRDHGPWLFGRNTDLTVFGGSACLSALLLCVGAWLGILHGEAPLWIWLACVVAVDVAHVWSSLFRVYFDRTAFLEKSFFYSAIPLISYALSLVSYAYSPGVFWRVLAYVAVFHFVRQQAGFLKLYARRGARGPAWETALERLTIYAVMLHPILVWHTRLPQPFAWFMQGDFVPGISRDVILFSGPVMWLLLGVFCLRQLWLARTGMVVPGKALIVLTTFGCWYGGIVTFASDFAFTVTNVLIHGLPYMTLTYRYARSQLSQPSLAARIVRFGALPFIAVCLSLASAEEIAWDHYVWHEHSAWLGQGPDLPSHVLLWLVPLLSLPQLTHYVLDGFVWRVRDQGSVLRRELESA